MSGPGAPPGHCTHIHDLNATVPAPAALIVMRSHRAPCHTSPAHHARRLATNRAHLCATTAAKPIWLDSRGCRAIFRAAFLCAPRVPAQWHRPLTLQHLTERYWCVLTHLSCSPSHTTAPLLYVHRCTFLGAAAQVAPARCVGGTCRFDVCAMSGRPLPLCQRARCV